LNAAMPRVLQTKENCNGSVMEYWSAPVLGRSRPGNERAFKRRGKQALGTLLPPGTGALRHRD